MYNVSRTPIPIGIETSGIGNIIRSSSKALTVTSNNFQELRRKITDIYAQRIELQKELKLVRRKLLFLNIGHYGSYLLLIGLFYKGIANARRTQQVLVEQLKQQLSNNFVRLSYMDKSQLEKSWLNCLDTFNTLMGSEKIWDITYSERVNNVKARTVAESAIQRIILPKAQQDIEFVRSDLPYIFLPNANGPNLFIFPNFLLLYKDNYKFGIFDLTEIDIVLRLSSFIEEERVPVDSEVVDYTWKKCNKNGSMDKRFKGNYQIPVVKYGFMEIESEEGLQEAFMFSNCDIFEEFAKSFEHHTSLLVKLYG